MASTQQSPVMVDSSAPRHSFSNPDHAQPTSEPQSSNASQSADESHVVSPSVTMPTSTSTSESTQAVPNRTTSSAEDESAIASVVSEQPQPVANDEDDSSNSGSSSDSSISTETPGTASTPRSAAHDSSHPVPETATSALDNSNTAASTGESDPSQPALETTPVTADDNVTEQATDRDIQSDLPPIPPLPVEIEHLISVDNVPSYVNYEEDTSEPSEAELKEIEANKREIRATDMKAVEALVFEDWSDPEQRPCKKIRLSWIVKGVRGTREKPNRARIMTSPAALIDGKYYSLKLFPRGNKSRNSMAVFVRCSTEPPDPPKTALHGSFKAYHGKPDTDLAAVEPCTDLTLELPTEKPAESNKDEESQHDPPSDPVRQVAPGTGTEADALETPRDDDPDDDSVSGDEEPDLSIPLDGKPPKDIENFRVSAQLGLAIYNPAEPRTCYTSSSCHQFYPHQDDWGWENAVSYWEDIHTRKHGQRQALLRDDTLAIDAYIRIFDDPTLSLFWHPADSGETQWDAKGLVGHFPFGTERLHHSPATAGIAAWSLLRPFRECLQRLDVGAWRFDSQIRPRPLIAQLQLMLFQMRVMKKDELYIHLDRVIEEIRGAAETYDNVDNFWAAFRRCIEFETEDDPNVKTSLDKIFGSAASLLALPKLPVRDVDDFQAAATKAFEGIGFEGDLPEFLPLTLDRQSFDTDTRQWRLHHDRVSLSEHIDLSQFCKDGNGKYTLYGLIIHNGVHNSDVTGRTSGRFFSVLRPAGPGGKWLAFSDGHGNKVFSLTQKKLKAYEGLSEYELKTLSSERETVHTAMYIKDDCIESYLSKELEPYKLPVWLKPQLAELNNATANDFVNESEEKTEPLSKVNIELFLDNSAIGVTGKLDLVKMKTNSRARSVECCQTMTADCNARIADLRDKICATLGFDPDDIKLWNANYLYLGHMSKSYMAVLPNDSLVGLCLGNTRYLSVWIHVRVNSNSPEAEKLAAEWPKLSGLHIEAPPPPPKAEPTQNTKDDTSRRSSTSSSGRSEDDQMVEGDPAAAQSSEISVTQAAPDAEQDSIREAVQHDADASNSPNRASETTAMPHQNADAQLIVTSESVVDDEQAAIEAAVRDTLTDIPRPPDMTIAEVTEVAASETASQHGSADQAGVNAPLSPSSQESNGAQPPVISMDAVSEASQDDVTAGLVTSRDNGGEVTAAPHGNGQVLLPVHTQPPLSHGQSLPTGVPIAVSGNQILILQPGNGEDISAEDAALIQQMIAADLEAAERDQRRRGHNGAGQGAGSDTGDDQRSDSRPSTPRQRINEVYGFLHLFDAEQQTFTTQATFLEAEDSTIANVVRKLMGFDVNKEFQLWRRCGTYRTTGVSSESTFRDLSFQDCREIIVGDQLGELKIEALKKEAKFVDPGSLMRYLAMVERKHPTAGITTIQAIELSDFGGDYYKGPLVRGQRHGSSCKVITKSGDQYKGPLVAGQKSGGKGKMIYQNGDIYDGEWLDDQKHGQGEFTEKRTGNRYVGGFENDMRWGKGVTYWEQADQQAALCQVCYFEEVDALFYRCGHVVACYSCARQCAADSKQCPVCRKPIDTVVKMYRA